MCQAWGTGNTAVTKPIHSPPCGADGLGEGADTRTILESNEDKRQGDKERKRGQEDCFNQSGQERPLGS